jgi:ubiquitin-conjugating enzyme E2 T
MLYVDPPPGISAWAREDDMRIVEAVVEGADGTPYAGGRFRLQLSMPQRYPFEPPKVHYVTPIYHPNIDSAGRICLDILNLPPKGAWKPSLNIATVLQSLRLLMAEPNPDDGLMVDITHQYVHDHARFEATAAEHTRKHASGASEGGGAVAAAAEAAEVSSTATAAAASSSGGAGNGNGNGNDSSSGSSGSSSAAGGGGSATATTATNSTTSNAHAPFAEGGQGSGAEPPPATSSTATAGTPAATALPGPPAVTTAAAAAPAKASLDGAASEAEVEAKRPKLS